MLRGYRWVAVMRQDHATERRELIGQGDRPLHARRRVPLGELGRGCVAARRHGDTVRDAGRNPGVVVDLAPGGGDLQHPAPPRFAVFAPVHEVAHAVGDERGPDLAGTEHAVGVAPDDDVGAGREQRGGEVLLLGPTRTTSPRCPSAGTRRACRPSGRTAWTSASRRVRSIVKAMPGWVSVADHDGISGGLEPVAGARGSRCVDP